MKRKYLVVVLLFTVVLVTNVIICGTASSTDCPPLQAPCGDSCCGFFKKCCDDIFCCLIGQDCCTGSNGNGCCDSWDGECCDGICCEEGDECIDNKCTYCATDVIYGKGSKEVKLLRTFRDEVLRPSPAGQEIIELYYKWSPSIVKAMEEDEKFKEDIKEMIDGVLGLIEEETE